MLLLILQGTLPDQALLFQIDYTDWNALLRVSIPNILHTYQSSPSSKSGYHPEPPTQAL